MIAYQKLFSQTNSEIVLKNLYNEATAANIGFAIMTHSNILILLILLLSCRGKQQTDTKKLIPIDSAKSSIYFSKKPTSYYYTIDTSKNEMENFDSGYIDTFSIAGIQFRLLSNPDSSSDLELQVMKGKTWVNNLKLVYGINGNAADTDINNDGFNDFKSSLLRGSEIYFFDPVEKQFRQAPINLAFEWTVINKAEKLYSSNYEIRGLYETNLFRLTNYKQTYFYRAPIRYNITDREETATVRLYKVRNNDLTDTIFMYERKFDLKNTGFDYKIFWANVLKQNGYR
jgi:hypothetical protein